MLAWDCVLWARPHLLSSTGLRTLALAETKITDVLKKAMNLPRLQLGHDVHGKQKRALSV